MMEAWRALPIWLLTITSPVTHTHFDNAHISAALPAYTFSIFICTHWSVSWLAFNDNVSAIVYFFPDTEDASETDLAKHDDDDYVEIKEQ